MESCSILSTPQIATLQTACSVCCLLKASIFWHINRIETDLTILVYRSLRGQGYPARTSWAARQRP